MNFIRKCLQRINPVLAPRRKRETAERHLRAIRVVYRWLGNDAADCDDWRAMGYGAGARYVEPEGRVTARLKWAAGIILDAGSVSSRTIPPDFPEKHWDAGDGVLKYTLKLAAEWLIREKRYGAESNTPLIHKAWVTAFPAIWAAVSADDWAVNDALFSAALAEMELIDPPNSLYWIQFQGTAEALDALRGKMGIPPLPAGDEEGTSGAMPDGYADADWYTLYDGSAVVSIQREAPISPSLLGDILMSVGSGTYIDTMCVGHESQPQYRGPASGLLPHIGGGPGTIKKEI